MPLSRDKAARAAQLANLNRGATARSVAPPGNARAVKHGGYSRVAVERLDAKTRELIAALSEDAPLRDPGGELPSADAAAVRLLAGCLLRLESVTAYLDRCGWQSEDGSMRPAVELEAQLRREAAGHLDGLGMSPRSRARLGLDVARGFDLAGEWAKGADDG